MTAQPAARVALRDGRTLAYDAGADAWDPPDAGPLRRGLMVCLLAPDGAGKSTLCDSLAAQLPFPVWTQHMELYGRPDPTHPRGSGVPGLRLAGRIGRQWRRYLRGRRARRAGALVVFDRYPYDTLLPPRRPPGRAGAAVRALLARILPPPDLALILDVPAEVLHARKAEHDVAELERQRAGYVGLAGRLRCPAEVVDASAGADEVRRAITAHVFRALAARG